VTSSLSRLPRARLETLTAEVAARGAALAGYARDLAALQARYLDEIGVLYAELAPLDQALADVEIRLGLRPPHEAADEADPDRTAPVDATQLFRGEPSADLKRAFRDVARAIHPDLAFDEAARYRRHSLMAEANRAYAERDEDRLRLILRAWERSPEAVIGDDADAEQARVERRIAELNERLIAIASELADLRASAIARLKLKIDEARERGWDLFAEMRLQVTGEIRRVRTRLAKLERQAPPAS
jgi:hypothetical protein